MLTEKGVVSQCIIGRTISAGKNLRSICNKILIQINSKVGGIPYNISDVPFVDKPTMVVGMSKTKFGSGSLITISASCTRFFSKFIHRKVQCDSGDAGTSIQQIYQQVFEEFKA